ncbi:hypothetical protein [Streptomyces sp. NPDC094472]|uniref:hypothetical protein n=1 Tax=Streptomyces sp. NPDC094472 TaxID=3155080 RepID=UPI00332DFDEE
MAAAVLLAASPAVASPGWDFLYGTTFGPTDGGKYRSLKVGVSHGGNFATCLNTSDDDNLQGYSLYEQDASGNPDEHVGYQTMAGDHCLYWYDIGKYVDGDNDRAEFYVVGSRFSESVLYFD